MRLGLILILVGALYLLKNLQVIDMLAWNTLWPIIVILIGITLVGRKGYNSRCWCGKCTECKASKNKVCSCDCDSCTDCDGK